MSKTGNQVKPIKKKSRFSETVMGSLNDEIKRVFGQNIASSTIKAIEDDKAIVEKERLLVKRLNVSSDLNSELRKLEVEQTQTGYAGYKEYISCLKENSLAKVLIRYVVHDDVSVSSKNFLRDSRLGNSLWEYDAIKEFSKKVRGQKFEETRVKELYRTPIEVFNSKNIFEASIVSEVIRHIETIDGIGMAVFKLRLESKSVSVLNIDKYTRESGNYSSSRDENTGTYTISRNLTSKLAVVDFDYIIDNDNKRLFFRPNFYN